MYHYLRSTMTKPREIRLDCGIVQSRDQREGIDLCLKAESYVIGHMVLFIKGIPYELMSKHLGQLNKTARLKWWQGWRFALAVDQFSRFSH